MRIFVLQYFLNLRYSNWGDFYVFFIVWTSNRCFHIFLIHFLRISFIFIHWFIILWFWDFKAKKLKKKLLQHYLWLNSLILKIKIMGKSIWHHISDKSIISSFRIVYSTKNWENLGLRIRNCTMIIWRLIWTLFW